MKFLSVMSETPRPEIDANVDVPNQTVQSEVTPHTSIADKLKSLLHLKSSTSRDIKLKPISYKVDREQIRANQPQEEPTKA